MARFLSLLLMFTGTTVIYGCADQKLIAPALVEQTETPDHRNEPADQPSPEPPAATSTKSAEVAVDSPHQPQRILLLALGGPLLVDVWLTIDGRPHEEGIAALIERVMSAGDIDGDGHPTWSEWSGNQEFLQGELMNNNPVQKRRIRNWVKRYDENDDGQIQRAEAAAWLGRDGGRSAAALTLRSSRAYFAVASTSSRLWQILDDDDNGQLSGDELLAASKRLFLLDNNDDRIVDLSELATLRDQLSAESPQRSSLPRRSTRQAAILLTDRSEAGSIDYLLGDLYAPRQQLGPNSFPARTRLFGELDNDGDQFLDNHELESLLEIAPHIKVSLDFTSDAETGKAVTRLRLLEHAQEVEQVQKPSANRLTLVTSDTRLNFSAHDSSNSQRDDQVVQRNQIGLMVHDRGDRLFEALDSDANGNLGEREITVAADRIREFDANGDRQLAADELLSSMTVAFVRSEPPGEQSFYVPSFAEASARQAQTPAWFGHADLNSDGDVSQSEFLGSTTQFSTLDSNRDGFISGDEAAHPIAPTLTDQPADKAPWVDLICGEGPQGIAPIGKNITLCGDVQLNPNSKDLTAVPGRGVVAALSKYEVGEANNLLSKQKFGDCEVRLEFLVGKASNSGVKLQQRYEIQLYDSHHKEQPTARECGGIYPHWLFQGEGKPLKYIDAGVPPIVNAAKPAGVWQTLNLVFNAPRFDQQGKKTKHARFVSVILNGQSIHQDIEVDSPTGNASTPLPEVPQDLLMLQLDHGAAAFRNVRVKPLARISHKFRRERP